MASPGVRLTARDDRSNGFGSSPESYHRLQGGQDAKAETNRIRSAAHLGAMRLCPVGVRETDPRSAHADRAGDPVAAGAAAHRTRRPDRRQRLGDAERWADQYQPAASPTVQATSAPATATPVATVTPGPDGYITHRVEWGDTLYSLARRYGTTVDAIVAANGLANENFIRVGQVLKIRQGDQGTTPPTGGTQTYVVQPGDTLYGIALRFGTTVAAIAQANGIVNPAFIRDGTRLTIPSGTSGTPSQSGSVYVVQPGDTLSSIAARFGTTYWAIAMANNLPNANFIRAGQTLIIPGR